MTVEMADSPCEENMLLSGVFFQSEGKPAPQALWGSSPCTLVDTSLHCFYKTAERIANWCSFICPTHSFVQKWMTGLKHAKQKR